MLLTRTANSLRASPIAQQGIGKGRHHAAFVDSSSYSRVSHWHLCVAHAGVEGRASISSTRRQRGFAADPATIHCTCTTSAAATTSQTGAAQRGTAIHGTDAVTISVRYAGRSASYASNRLAAVSCTYAATFARPTGFKLSPRRRIGEPCAREYCL